MIQDIIKAFKEGNKVLIAGNGGSAAIASHIAAEFVGRFKKDRPALPAISLCSDLSIITAVANDYGYENVFSRQVQAYGKKGDILILMSTSGKSPNILAAKKVGEEMGLVVFFMTGENCRGMSAASIQQEHLETLHEMCEEVENTLFP